DHHVFSDKDLKEIDHRYQKLDTEKKIILTTEKDYVRGFSNNELVYYLPINTAFLEHGDDFNTLVKKYISKPRA
ncbi:MAG: tetraacyldisaccharide 4'-kinase, partial [Flavobacteriaceae bacterium]|nr:tetraacyldisaccharide 4'-kinase [Flavobacteriaceae bacterium]